MFFYLFIYLFIFIFIYIFIHKIGYCSHPHYRAPRMKYVEGPAGPIYVCRPKKYVLPVP